MDTTEVQVIRAVFDSNTITVYQAFNKEIALSATTHQTFLSPPFKKNRMTWIKPSFLWMMYRSGWASKENQECILEIKIKRIGFDWAVKNACLSSYNAEIHHSFDEWKAKLAISEIRLQWDPERDILFSPLPYRSIQIGLSGTAIDKYLHNWIVSIEDITKKCAHIHELVNSKNFDKALLLLPKELRYF